MARRSNKGPSHLATSAIAGRALLDGVSKAALVEAYLAVLAQLNGACDTPPTLDEVEADINPVLQVRGDRQLKK